ncbi:uncharacterized protein FPRO_01778 [Fusarium proliferatum ET1]|uniref:Uncharacterized protein n=1 Tax=Fusarium proliferatum (strain ET1) TaxID=1227346 RepID=A0A1L7V058_FUSPR|nr:uncharacterized protein FPRO_01778 [Fusarium proliferatum ET1]CZR33380.1 uncharacterized protein FPRO_01778 [Fusarium proliferatum ET1]
MSSSSSQTTPPGPSEAPSGRSSPPTYELAELSHEPMAELVKVVVEPAMPAPTMHAPTMPVQLQTQEHYEAHQSREEKSQYPWRISRLNIFFFIFDLLFCGFLLFNLLR